MSMHLQGAHIHGGEFRAINQTVQNGEFAVWFHSERTKTEIRMS